jgi:hypothetical protein
MRLGYVFVTNLTGNILLSLVIVKAKSQRRFLLPPCPISK